MIKEIIAKLDVVLAQVIIEAIILEVNLTDSRNTGISYLGSRMKNGSLTGQGGVNNLSSSASGFLTGNSSSSSTTGVTNAISSASGSTLAIFREDSVILAKSAMISMWFLKRWPMTVA